MEAEEGPQYISLSPTFSSYSSGSSNLAEIAARVVREVGEEPFVDDENYGWESQGSVYRFRENLSNGHARESESAEGVRTDDCGENGDDDDDEFEFAVLCREPDASTRSAHEIFSNGQIKPVYPVFDMDLLLDNGSRVNKGLENSKKKPAPRRSPLRELMNEESRKTTKLSSSEADDLRGIPSDMYCVWSPGTEKTSPGRSNKRNFTESSKRWKLRDLLYNYSRSKSQAEDARIMRRTSSKKDNQSGNVSNGKKDSRSGVGVTSSISSNSGFSSFPAQNARSAMNRSVKETEKRRTYLPYRQNLVGCVADVNATTI